MTQTGFHHATPIYEYLPGWSDDISSARSLADLPATARDYVAFLGGGVAGPHQRDRGRSGSRCDDLIVLNIRTVLRFDHHGQ
jgi:hypothetical protein